MAPTVGGQTAESAIVDINVSSLELDVRDAQPPLLQSANSPSLLSPRNALPLQQRSLDLNKRAVAAPSRGQGITPPENINNGGFFALFAILGVAMVLCALWFFFWAKNGGFHFQEGDWDDYKSTVLRRKGPDGKTLSNATKSTKLGGGTIAGSQHYAWQKNIAKSVVGRDEKGRKGVLAKRGWGNTHSITYTDDTLTESFATQTVYDEMRELRSEPDLESGTHHSRRYRDRDVRQYKKEKPARVGGLNRVADSSRYDSERSEILTESAVSASSSQPILPKSTRQQDADKAERRAREEAVRMERRWKREAEAAAAALARESTASQPPPQRKSASPSKPSASYTPQKTRRESSPKKRDFSYSQGPESEVLSTAYTQSTSNRTASYYDEYRPGRSENPRYSTEYGRRMSGSPTKKKTGGGQTRAGGYRRGGQDSDLE